MQPSRPTSHLNRRSSMRKSPRRTVKVECRKGALGLGPNIAAGFLDLSETGLRVITKAELKARDEVEVVLQGYGMTKAIKRIANVCWALALEDGQYCVGLHFQKHLPYRDVHYLAVP